MAKSLDTSSAGSATQSIHAGHDVGDTNARAVPVYMTTAYLFDSPEHASDLFELKASGNIYTRLMNPTTEVLEKRISQMESGLSGVCTSSGMSAIMMAILNITSSGQNIVASNALYGGTITLMSHTLARLGIEARLIDINNLESLEASIDEKTRMVYLESVGNPKNTVPDYAAVAQIAHQHGIPMIVDNTATPVGLCPVNHGADVVIHSLTKYFGGHGNAMGGIIIDSGKFPWNNGKFPEIAHSDASYHGMNFWDHCGGDSVHDAHGRSINPAYSLRSRVCMLRDLGCAISPFNAFLILQGVETITLRWEKICENAMFVAKWLEENPDVTWVNYPGLPSHPDYKNAKKYLKGSGGILGFGIKGGISEAKNLISRVKLISHVANIGDSRTLIVHPASTTHQQLSPSELAASGITPDFIRLSVGLENIEDIISDLDQAICGMK